MLVAIAAHANGDGKAYPSLARIAAATRIDRRHVPRSISRLEDAGLLRRRRRKGERGGWDRTTYELIFEDQQLSRSGAPSATASDDFEIFWRAYPSRSPHENPKKPAALKFASLVKAGADPAKIIAGARRYAAYVTLEVRDRRFVKTAITWLNQEQWQEQYGPAEPAPLRAGMI